MGQNDIPQLQPVTARCLKPGEAATLRIIELEDALRGLVGLIQLMQAGGRFEAGYDPTRNHRYQTALEVLK